MHTDICVLYLRISLKVRKSGYGIKSPKTGTSGLVGWFTIYANSIFENQKHRKL